MQAVGRADINDLNVVPGNQFLPFGSDELESQLLTLQPAILGLEFGKPNQSCAYRHRIIKKRKVAVAVCVYPAHEAESNDAYSERFHRINLLTWLEYPAIYKRNRSRGWAIRGLMS